MGFRLLIAASFELVALATRVFLISDKLLAGEAKHTLETEP
jgi:hypothetical protein